MWRSVEGAKQKLQWLWRQLCSRRLNCNTTTRCACSRTQQKQKKEINQSTVLVHLTDTALETNGHFLDRLVTLRYRQLRCSRFATNFPASRTQSSQLNMTPHTNSTKTTDPKHEPSIAHRETTGKKNTALHPIP